MTLQAVAELVYRQVNPNPKDESPSTLAEYIESAKLRFAYRTWERNRLNKSMGEGNVVDGALVRSYDMTVVDKKASIAEISPLRMLTDNMWIQSVGGISCGGCQYTVMDINSYKLLCDDESRNPEYDKAAVPVGSSILFPDGAHAETVELIYVNDGSDVEDDMDVDGSIGAMVQSDLFALYSKQFKEDKSNNSNPD